MAPVAVRCLGCSRPSRWFTKCARQALHAIRRASTSSIKLCLTNPGAANNCNNESAQHALLLYTCPMPISLPLAINSAFLSASLFATTSTFCKEMRAKS